MFPIITYHSLSLILFVYFVIPRGWKAVSISGDKAQNARNQALSQFKDGSCPLLVFSSLFLNLKSSILASLQNTLMCLCTILVEIIPVVTMH